MQILRLHVEHLRNLAEVDLEPSPGINLVLGENGAGKTSLLEAIHVLAYGRSFRGRVRDGLVGTGHAALSVFVEWREGERTRRVGLRHAGATWEGLLDGQPVLQLGDLCAAIATLTFEPGSHALVQGSSDARRRYLDWGLFHVEPDFLPLWRRHARALRQRNALLKQRAGDGQLEAWDAEFAAAGEILDQRRERYLERLQPRLRAISSDLLPRLGHGRFVFQPGWRREQMPLVDALLLARDRDRTTGFTSVGAHRADWRIEHAGRPAQEALSRGQAKLTALACLLAQAEDVVAQRGHWPIILLDDLASELDPAHQARLLSRLMATDAQVFITGTEIPAALRGHAGTTMFHVEQGRVVPFRG